MKNTWLKSIPIALVIATAIASSASAQISHQMRHSAKMAHSPHHHAMAGHHKHMHDMHMAMMMQMHGMKMDAKGHATMMAMHAKHHGEQGGMAQMHAAMMASRPARGQRKAIAAKSAGSCGTYLYWKAGQCLDARRKA